MAAIAASVSDWVETSLIRILHTPITWRKGTQTVDPLPMIRHEKGRVSLLLQGPIGPFFRGLARELQRRGDVVWQVCFNGGDQLFSIKGTAIPYRGDLASWPAWLEGLLASHQVDRVLLFGDCREQHRMAIALCRRLGVPVWVFEEGYLRPHFMTLESGGVNAHSPLTRDPAAIRALTPDQPLPPPRGYHFTMLRRALTCIAYYLAVAALAWRYPAYRHHRRTALIPEGWCWVRAFWRRYSYAVRERGVVSRLLSLPPEARVFLFPLQVAGDTQLSHHSTFGSVEASIEHVLASFAAHAQAEAVLVVKHHPMDRGYTDYRTLLLRRAEALGLRDRLIYCHDQPLPHLLRLVCGVVTVNSTVGLSALAHGLPVICLGKAIYDIPGITHQDGLDAFWRAPQAPDRPLLTAFRRHLLRTTQLNACSASSFSTWDLLDRLPDFSPHPIRVGAETGPPPHRCGLG